MLMVGRLFVNFWMAVKDTAGGGRIMNWEGVKMGRFWGFAFSSSVAGLLGGAYNRIYESKGRKGQIYISFAGLAGSCGRCDSD
jgi:hypothetical protein